jgi:hypothetical protein
MMTDEMLEGLASKPWLRPFVEDDDEDLEPAEERWREAVDLAVRELEALGVVVHERAKTKSGLQTTMLLVPSGDER